MIEIWFMRMLGQSLKVYTMMSLELQEILKCLQESLKYSMSLLM